jgi:hypothetical protein
MTIRAAEVSPAELAALGVPDHRRNGLALDVEFRGQADTIGVGRALGAAACSFIQQMDGLADKIGVTQEVVEAEAVRLIVESMLETIRAKISLPVPSQVLQ